METEEENLDLVAVLGDDKTYSLKNFEDIKAKAEAFIKTNSVFTKIEGAEDYKPCKEERANLNRALKNVQQARIKVTDYYMVNFQSQCKEIESLLKSASDAHSTSIHAVEEAAGKQSTKAYKLEIRTYDEKIMKKVEAYAIKYGCTVKIS